MAEHNATPRTNLPGNLLAANLATLTSRQSPSISPHTHYHKYLPPAQDQDGFRREHSTTSALLQLTTLIGMGFNQKNPPDRTVCVVVDLSAAFNTVCHNNLLSKINRSQLSTATARWLSSYLSQYVYQRCKVNVYESQQRRPTMLQAVTIVVHLLHC